MRGRGPEAAAGPGRGGARERGRLAAASALPPRLPTPARRGDGREVAGLGWRGGRRGERPRGREPRSPGGNPRQLGGGLRGSSRLRARRDCGAPGRGPEQRCGPAPACRAPGTVRGPRVRREPLLLGLLGGAVSAGFLGSASGVSREPARGTAWLATEEGPGARRGRDEPRARRGDGRVRPWRMARQSQRPRDCRGGAAGAGPARRTLPLTLRDRQETGGGCADAGPGGGRGRGALSAGSRTRGPRSPQRQTPSCSVSTVFRKTF